MIFGYIRKKNEKKHRLVVAKISTEEDSAKNNEIFNSENEVSSVSDYSQSNASSYFEPPLLNSQSGTPSNRADSS